MGRETKCTPETTKRIIEAIKMGTSYANAAKRGGIDYATLRRWVLRGEAEIARLEANTRLKPKLSEVVYCNFCEALWDAQAEGEFILASRIRLASAKDWRAAAWILERRYSETWGDNQELWQEIRQIKEQLHGVPSDNQE